MNAKEIQVLHVDDQPDFADLTTTFLERESDQFAVKTAHSADEGLERINGRPPDCIVSDYNMPGMDGLEFLQAVREEYPDLPFILFTGRGSEAVASEAVAAGVTDYLQKGSGSEQYELLTNRIRNAVQARRETERAERQEELMRLTEFTGDTGGFELDRESDAISLTAGARRIIGRPDQHEILLEGAVELFHADDRGDIQETLATVFETGEGLHDTWRLQPDDGDQRLLDIRITPIVENGEVTKLRGAGHDITDQKERQEELRRNERRLNAILEHSTDRLGIIDAEGRYTFVSPSAETLMGHDPADLTGEEAFEYVHPEDREETRATFQQILNDPDGIYTAEYRYRDAEGSWRWVESRAKNRLDDPAIEGVVINSREVTKRMQREQESQRTRALMTNMEELADAGAWEYEPDAETLNITDGTRRLYGLGPDADLTLKAALDAVHPEDRDRVADRLNTCLETGEPYEMDVRLVTPDGEQRWITARGERVTTDGNGNVARGYIQDITEQKQSEHGRKQERDLVNGIVETVPVGLSVVDADGSISFVNERLESICGRSLEELEDIPHDDARYDLVDEHGEPLESGETPFNRVASRETTIHDQVVGIRRPSGERVWLSVSGAPQYDDGELERTVFALEDITDRRELEREFTQIKTVAESLNDAVYVLDDDGQFTYVNDEFAELTGYSEETILGSTPDLIKDGETVEEAERQLGVLLSDTGPDTVTFETIIQPDSGSPVVCEDHMGVLPYEGDSFNGSVGVLREITERKRRERELRQERNRLDEFASVVSHDLRNPLTVADGRLELAQETCESPHLAQAADAIGRSQALIEDLLTLAREGEDVSEIEPVAFADVAESSWQTVESQSATLETHATQTLQADQSRLKQLFENLYRNAIEHGGDDVTVSVGTIDDGFYVADTGPGIPEGDRQEIFEAGYSTSEEGTGFGLRIVTQIAEAHGWEITVTESEQGGARFEVTGVEFTNQ